MASGSLVTGARQVLQLTSRSFVWAMGGSFVELLIVAQPFLVVDA